MSIVNGTVTTKTEGGVTYGISISDLQKATNSAKRDLMLLHCESVNGLGIESEEEGITNGTQTIKSAFSLRDMPLPNGWSRVSSDDSTKGDLVMYKNDLTKEAKVANPRWNLWADNVNFGKFVLRDTTSGKYYFEYNIFQPFNGAGMPNLQQWQGYNQNNVHEPKFDISDNVKSLEFHNGVYAPLMTASSESMLRTSLSDHLSVWLDPRTSLASCKAAIGNLVDWDSSYGGVSTNGKSSRLATKSGTYNFDANGVLIYGVSVEVKEGGDVASPLNLGRAYASGSTALNSSSSSTDKDKYRNGVDINLEYACEYGASLYKKMKEKGGTLPAYATLGGVIAPNLNGYGSLTASQVVYGERVVGSKLFNITATFDEKKSASAKNTRVIFTNNTAGGIEFGVAHNGASQIPYVRSSTNDKVGGFGILVFAYNPSTSDFVFGSSDYSALVELTTADSSGNVTNYVRKVVDLKPYNLDTTSIWSADESLTWHSLTYKGKTLPESRSSVYLLHVPNINTYTVGENTTAVVTLIHKGVSVTFDANFTEDTYTEGAASRCPVYMGTSLGDIYYLPQRYTRTGIVHDVSGMSNIAVTSIYDFLRYNASSKAEIQQNIDNFYGKTIRIYKGLDNTIYKDFTFPSNAASVTGTGWYNEQVGLSVTWGDVRPCATKDGVYTDAHNVYTLRVSNLRVSAGDNYRVEIIG